jgi:hypothetical protein
MMIIMVTGIVYATPDDNTSITIAESDWEGEVVLAIPMKMLGDANDDGKVNDEDILEVASYIIGNHNPSDKFNEVLADVNKDGTINAADIVAITNIIKDN